MRNDFTTVHDRRHTRSIKWDKMNEVYNIDHGDEVLPMWIADMDYAVPDVIIQAMQERLQHPIFGYSYMCEGCKKALVDWNKRHHQWTIESEWILFQHGVIPAIASSIQTFTQKGDKILMTPPVYPPFFGIPTENEREVVYSPLIENQGTYTIDFDNFEQQLKKGVKLFILCNPHNPGGTVWTIEELRTIIQLCITYDVIILSDEIHSDLVFAPHQHTPIASLPEAKDAKIITCMAPTKTFNLAGIQAATMIVPCPTMRNQLEKQGVERGQMELNALAAAAYLAAYKEGEPWLLELKEELTRNMEYVIRELNEHVPAIKVSQPQSTYLLWLDGRGLNQTEEELMQRLLHDGKVALDPGSKYGKEGIGFLRMNVAAPFSLIEDGVQRIIRALK